MEVKDINNSVSNMLTNPKTNVMALVSGEDFLSLLSNKETVSKTEEVAKFSPNTKKAAQAVTNNKDNGKNNELKTNSNSDNQSKKADKNAKADSRDNAQKTTSKDVKKEKSPVKTKSSSSEPVQAESPASTAVNTASPAESVVNASSSAPAEAVATVAAPEDAVAAPLSIIALDYIAGLDELTLVNPLDGEIVTLTGEEVVKKLASGEWPHLLKEDAQKLAADYAKTIPAVEAKDGKNDFFAFDGFEAIENVEADVDLDAIVSAATAKANQPVKENTVVETDDISLRDTAMKEQIEKLEEVLGTDKKTKVEVNAKEEKAPLIDIRSLASNHLSLQEVGDDATPETIVNTPDASKQNPAQTQAAGINMNNVVGFNNHIIQNIDASLNAKPVEANITNVSSHVVSNGGEYVANTRNDILADNEKASFRDVYRGMSKEVVDQVKINITKSAVKGVDKIDVQLKPAELGSVEVKMQIGKDGKIQAHIISSRPETMEALQKDLSSLEKAFNDAGFETNNQSFTFSFKEQQANQNKEHGLRDFLGNALESETDLLGQDYLPENWDGKSALNIRV